MDDLKAASLVSAKAFYGLRDETDRWCTPLFAVMLQHAVMRKTRVTDLDLRFQRLHEPNQRHGPAFNSSLDATSPFCWVPFHEEHDGNHGNHGNGPLPFFRRPIPRFV